MPELALECKRALGNRWFIFALALSVSIAVVGAVINVASYLQLEDIFLACHFEDRYTYLSSYSSFTKWIASDHVSAAVELFFVLIPLLVAIGYSWSFASDWQSGYIEQLLCRTLRQRYYFAKYAATFASGCLIVTIPLVINFLICACFIPSYMPDPFDARYIPISQTELFGTLFYSAPQVYVVLRIVVDGTLCGLWAVAILALSCIMRNRVALIALPYIMLLLLKHVGQCFYVFMRNNGFEHFGFSVTLFDQLRAQPDAFFCPWWATLLCACAMLAFSIVVPLCTRKRDVL